MSKYTTQLRYICEAKAGLTESTSDFTAVINASYDKIIHPDTPLFDPAYAPVLYKKIIKHYYFDEIAHETVGQFIMRINIKLDEILPYYNMLYKSAALDFNPFYDVDYTVEGNREDNNTDNRTRTDDLQSQRTDDLETLRTDNLQMERTDDLETLRTDNLQTERTDDLETLRTDNLQTERTDDLETLRTDNLQSQRTDNLQSQRTDNLANHAESTSYDLFSDTPEGSLSGVDQENYLSTAKKVTSEADGTNTGTQTTADTGTQVTADTGTQKTENSGTQTVENTGTQKTENSGTQTVENTGTQKTENSGTQTVENTGTQKTENSGTQTVANTGTQTNNAIIHNINEYAEHVFGKRGSTSYSKMLQEFRDTFINIDMLIINELKNMFMGVY